MRVLIVEDELPAAEKLVEALKILQPDTDIAAVIRSCHETVNWLQRQDHPDLIFMDIELADGPSFGIFEQVQINCPVVFVTAYDEYWQEAFEHNSIDYLLKPVSNEKLQQAMQKYDQLQSYFMTRFSNLQKWKQQEKQSGFRERFLVKRGNDFIPVLVQDIAYFYATHKLVCMVDAAGQKFLLDRSLSDIEQELNPVDFFRINRKYLVALKSITRIKTFGKGKLQVELKPETEEEILISQESAGDFKLWAGA